MKDNDSLISTNACREEGNILETKSLVIAEGYSVLSNIEDINFCHKNDDGLLYQACENGNDIIVQQLLDNGADINFCMEDGASPLYIACLYGHDSTVNLLLSKGAKLDLCTNDGTSPLVIACQNGQKSTVQHLITNGADINLCDYKGASPLFIGCLKGHDDIVQLLLSNKADVNMCLKNGATLLGSQNSSEISLPFFRNEDVEVCIDDGTSPLFIACKNGHHKIVQLLLDSGADFNLYNVNKTSPI